MKAPLGHSLHIESRGLTVTKHMITHQGRAQHWANHTQSHTGNCYCCSTARSGHGVFAPLLAHCGGIQSKLASSITAALLQTVAWTGCSCQFGRSWPGFTAAAALAQDVWGKIKKSQ